MAGITAEQKKKDIKLREQVKEYFESGKSWKECEEKFGVPAGTCKSWGSRYKWALRGTTRREALQTYDIMKRGSNNAPVLIPTNEQVAGELAEISAGFEPAIMLREDMQKKLALFKGAGVTEEIIAELKREYAQHYTMLMTDACSRVATYVHELAVNCPSVVIDNAAKIAKVNDMARQNMGIDENEKVSDTITHLFSLGAALVERSRKERQLHDHGIDPTLGSIYKDADVIDAEVVVDSDEQESESEELET